MGIGVWYVHEVVDAHEANFDKSRTAVCRDPHVRAVWEGNPFSLRRGHLPDLEMGKLGLIQNGIFRLKQVADCDIK